MPLDLATLAAPAHTALLTIEIQTDVVGEDSFLPDLAAASHTMVPNVAALARAARVAGALVVHGTAEFRRDGLGGNTNARLFVATAKRREGVEPGPEPKAVHHPGLGVEPGDLVVPRIHGLSALYDTGLDSVLRNTGITTLVVTGVSVNVAVLSTVMDAVNRGYQVVVPRDAVAGVGADYVEAVLDNTISLLATITTTADLVDAWTP
ncbi:MAG: cysteine hydrolase [Acidimicrobiia bacterium]|jgi:nicotinamidase-related amidase